MRRSIVLGLLVSLVAASAMACSSEAREDPGIDDAPPADEQQEEEVVAGVTKLASKLQDPSHLTSFGDSIFFTTTYGYATQQFAQYNHDIWVKTGSGRAKRLYKELYGATWGMVATKNGIYEINEGYASVMRYPLDGSNREGESIFHSSYDYPGDEMPEVGIRVLAADDDGLVLGLRSSADESKPGGVTALTPTGKNPKKLGATPGGASALHLAGGKVYVGARSGEVFVANRDGSGSMTKIASGEGAVGSILAAGDDVFFGTDKGLFVKRKGAPAAEKLVPEGTGELAVARDQLLFTQWKTGVFSMPLAGGVKKQVLKTGAPGSIMGANGFVWATDRSYGRCRQTDEGQACAFDGAAYRIKF